jgi:hypothetical protein
MYVLNALREKEIFMMSSKTRRSVGTTVAHLLVLMLIATAYAVSPFIGSAKADPDGLVGTWVGQGTYNTGVPANTPPFDMTLSISAGPGNSFSGFLTENVYQTKVNVSGTLDGSTFNFTDTSYVSGNEILLNCNYTGNVSSGMINGSWSYPIASLGTGTITLSQQSDIPAP